MTALTLAHEAAAPLVVAAAEIPCGHSICFGPGGCIVPAALVVPVAGRCGRCGRVYCVCGRQVAV